MTDTVALIQKLRHAADECSAWDTGLNPPFSEWSGLMEVAATALQEAEDDEPFNLGDLKEEAFDTLAGAESHYVDEEGDAHIVVSLDLLQRCHLAARQ